MVEPIIKFKLSGSKNYATNNSLCCLSETYSNYQGKYS